MYRQFVECNGHCEIYDAPADIDRGFYDLQKVTDTYVYLLLLYRTWKDCSEDIRSNRVEHRYAFWKTTKCLLNYVNAIYSIKEYILYCYGKTSPVYAPLNEAFLECNWFRIACEYRNRIIHQANILRDYDPKDGKVYLCWDEFIEAQIEHMQKNAKIHKREKDLITNRMLELSSKAITDDAGKHFFDMVDVVLSIDNELFDIMGNVLTEIMNNMLISAIDELLSMIFQRDGVYHRTVYLNGNPKEVLDPCDTLETVVIESLQALYSDHTVAKALLKHLRDKGYNYFFLQESTLDDMLTNGIKAEIIYHGND